MKKIQSYLIIFFLLIAFENLHSQEFWTKQNSPTDRRIWRVFCIDSLTCWAVGDSGLIMHTSNGGLDWRLQNSGIYDNIQDVYLLNKNLGWAVAIKFDEPSGSYFLKTTNGGTTWQSRFFDTLNVYFLAVHFIDSLIGFLGGAPSYTLFRTSDGGNTWITPQFDSTQFSGLPIFDIEFYSGEYGFACGGRRDLIGVIWKTTDSGLSWSSLELGPEPLIELAFIDSLNIIGVGGDFEYGAGVARTTNGGKNWIYTEPGIFGVATGLSLRNKNEAWACISGENKFLVTSDLGISWQLVNTFDNSSINDITFSDSSHGFAVGDNGVILKYNHSNPSLIVDDVSIPTTNFLYQNYPNPFNPSTRIRYQVSGPSLVSLKIYDVLGNEVAILVDEYKPIGNYEVEFNPVSSIQYPTSGIRNLVSGIYFYQLKVGESVQTNKMILLR